MSHLSLSQLILKQDDEEVKLLSATAKGNMMAEAKLPTTNGHTNLFEDLE